MKSNGYLARVILLIAACIALHVNAQSSNEFKDGYAQGYKEGFDAGYRKGIAEQHSATEAASKNFPIAIISATYGPEGARERCDATQYVRRPRARQTQAGRDHVPVWRDRENRVGVRTSIGVSFLRLNCSPNERPNTRSPVAIVGNHKTTNHKTTNHKTTNHKTTTCPS